MAPFIGWKLFDQKDLYSPEADRARQQEAYRQQAAQRRREKKQRVKAQKRAERKAKKAQVRQQLYGDTETCFNNGASWENSVVDPTEQLNEPSAPACNEKLPRPY